MTNMENTQPILILGGTGKTGRRVAERLAARGLANGVRFELGRRRPAAMPGIR